MHHHHLFLDSILPYSIMFFLCNVISLNYGRKFLLGGVPEEEIFTGEELKNEDENGPQILDYFLFYISG